MPETITLRKLDVPDAPGWWAKFLPHGAYEITYVLALSTGRVLAPEPGVKWLGPLPTE